MQGTYAGEAGSYEELATALLARKGSDSPAAPGAPAAATAAQCQTLAEVFARVRDGVAVYGVAAAENSLNGTTGETYDLLLQSDVTITGETVVPVEHCLVGYPGSRAGRIKEVRGRPQDLAQCAPYLTGLGVELVPQHSSAGAARHVKTWGSPEVAAIASAHAAQVYGLDVLTSGIGSNPQNFTRYLRIQKDPSPRGARNRTSLALGLEHKPDSLFLALSSVACRGINLTKIESRPVRRDPYEYIFWLEFEGHVEDWPVKQALDELKAKTIMLRVLGSYPVEE